MERLPITDLENFKLLGIALATGLLIGLERGWRTRNRDEGLRVAGLRTYGLISLLGALWGIVAQQSSPSLMGFAFLALTLVLLVAYNKSLDKFEDFSITSIIASLITFTLGALIVFGHATLSCAAAVVITSLLDFKPLLHSWMKKLEQQELNATLQLLLISVVMLPVLPDQGYGPWLAFNPYRIWCMVVLIASISYLGYFAVKIVGDRYGPILTGAFGGLVSSTAVTLNLSRVSKHYPGRENALSAGILTACATLFVRTLLLTSIMNQALCRLLLPSLLLMSVITYFFAFLLWRSAREYRTGEEVNLENPFQLGMALKFGLFLAVILLLSNLLKAYFGDMGTYVLAALSGLADVDPLTLSLSRMSADGLDIQVSARAIIIAVTVNSLVKSIFSLVIGGVALGYRVTITLSTAIAIGLMLS
ncbi:MAG: MgtC/SapB family protein [Methylovulum sp.]|nr:MgtC/SapB family protein [Methylovulum sp.]